MGIEIERKWLVTGDGWKKLPLIKKLEIEQGYLLNTAEKSVRVRVTQDQAFLTVKASIKGKKIARSEFEYEIPLAEGQDLIKMCPATLSKTRHVLRDDKNQILEVDVFKKSNRGLKIVEVEMPDEKQQVHTHSWFGEEVTGVKAYHNSVLVQKSSKK